MKKHSHIQMMEELERRKNPNTFRLETDSVPEFYRQLDELIKKYEIIKCFFPPIYDASGICIALITIKRKERKTNSCLS